MSGCVPPRRHALTTRKGHPGPDGIAQVQERLRMPGQEGAGIGQGCRQPPAPAARLGEGSQQQPEHQRQPDGGAQDGQLQGRVAREVVGEGEDGAGQESRQAFVRTGQVIHQPVGEEPGQSHMHHGFDLEPVEPGGGVAPGQGESQEQIAQRVENRGLHVGQEGMAAHRCTGSTAAGDRPGTRCAGTG